MLYTIGGVEREVALIPEPVHTELSGGCLALPLSGRIAQNMGDADLSCLLGMQLADDIEGATGIRWDVAKGDRWSACIRLEIGQDLGSQSYRLDIGEDGIVVTGGDVAGVRNGVQTLRQIIRQCAPTLPMLRIEDHPVYQVRGYYLDVTRGRVPTLAWLKEWVDALCLYKYNQLQLYIEHTFKFDGFSETWRGTGPLEPAEIIELDDYCDERGIELVPSVSTFGHHYMALRTKELGHLGEFPEDAGRPYSFVERQEHHTLNITTAEAFDFSTRLIDSYEQLFRSRTFNIGADETFDLGKGRSKAEAERRGIAVMYAEYVSRLCGHLSEQGRKPMFWGDIAVEMPEILTMLPKDVILLNWLYDPKITEDKVRLVAQSGAKQYVCPAVWCWNALLPKLDSAWNNISRLARYGVDYGAAGFLVTDWGDYGHVNDPRMAIPGMIYGAQCGWRPQSPKGKSEIDRLISQLEYGDGNGRYVAALNDASHCVTFGWDMVVDYFELDDGNGALNHDVLSATWVGEDAKTDWIRASPDLAEARRRLLETLKPEIERTESTNVELRSAAQRLSAAASGARYSARRDMPAVLTAIEGQRLLNQFGRYMAVRAGVLDEPWDVEDARKLARKLEEWGETYAEVWRQVSAESELKRVLGMVWRCADALRQ